MGKIERRRCGVVNRVSALGSPRAVVSPPLNLEDFAEFGLKAPNFARNLVLQETPLLFVKRGEARQLVFFWKEGGDLPDVPHFIIILSLILLHRMLLVHLFLIHL
jgi:hypothetical protein